MNELTQLFVKHLEHSPAVEDVEAFVAALEVADDNLQAIQVASFRYMAAIQRELFAFVATVDVQAAAVAFQE
jgi:hypothetical protein